jgi:hypothetical protein
MAPKTKMPKTLGECIDLAYAARAERLAYQKYHEDKIAEMKARENEIEEYILARFAKQDIEGARGSTATATVSRMTVPQVTDWTKVHDYIVEHEAWDLMEKRMARLAYRDRLEAGEVIPGTEPFVKVQLSLTRIPTKE